MKILFLDIDGVLNSDDFFESTRSNCSFKLSEGICDDGVRYIQKLDVKAVRLLCDFVIEHDIKIILSTTWREAFSISFIRGLMMRIAAFPDGCFMGKTPIFPHRVKRGAEISSWLGGNKNCQYIIFDDLEPSDFLRGQRGRLIQTDPRIGLTTENLKAAKELLEQ